MSSNRVVSDQAPPSRIAGLVSAIAPRGEALSQLPMAFELHFSSLLKETGGYAFPCDAEGHVDLDRLGDRLRCSYLYARALVGRDYARPVVRAVALH